MLKGFIPVWNHSDCKARVMTFRLNLGFVDPSNMQFLSVGRKASVCCCFSPHHTSPDTPISLL